ncbi:hypothetical protein F5887DRAFT_1069346 [Amanita rubescens]|nr:hypothetical protein F5887DRAFT_1069346 [Amanita rubescens]
MRQTNKPNDEKHKGTQKSGNPKRAKDKALLSTFPIKRLTPEILAEVFWHCLPETTLEYTMARSEAPLLLCRVCSSWRNLALATPALWTNVGVAIRKLTMDPLVASQVINTWLERSGTLPLVLYLMYLPLWPQSAMPTLLETILTVFYSHSYRWQTVTLFLPEPPLMSIPQLDAPLLRSFSLEGMWDKPIRFPFRKTPRLTGLTWPLPLDIPANPQIPWFQISRLYISRGMSYASALQVIRSCPKLEDLNVGFSPLSDTAMVVDSRLPRKPVVKSLSLRKLRIIVLEDSSPFLESLTLPALKEFEFEVDPGDNDDDDEGPPLTTPPVHKAILDLLTRSNCKLDRLELSNCGFSPSAILSCFEHGSLETIEALKIGNVRDQSMVNDGVLIRLTILRSSPSRVLLPKLTRLELEMCLGASSGMLGRMVHSRRFLPGKHGIERLKYFSVTGQELRRADKDLINKAVLDGLEVEIPDTTSDAVDPRKVLASIFAMYN